MTGGKSSPDSSRRVKGCTDSDDKISNLPDSILSHILSFLPTKMAVATGILSQRWKFLWTTTTNLDFCYPGDLDFCYPGDYIRIIGKSSQFVEFVNYVMLLHKPGCLNKLSLSLNRRCTSSFYVNTWISAAVARNVQELFVSVVNSDLAFKVPRSMFTCQVLQSLELNFNICISTEIVISLPKLERLKLISVYFRFEGDFCKLLAGCPMLKYLYIKIDMGKMVENLHMYIDDGIVFNFIVSSTSLRHLELYVHDQARTLEDTSLCSVELASSSLEYIKLRDRISSIVIRESLSSLVEANIELSALENEPGEYDYCNPVVEAVHAFDCAKALTLSSQVIWALTCATIKLRTKFKRLTKLEVDITTCWSSLQDLLKFSDSLEVLTVNNYNYYSRSRDHLNDSIWKKPKQVPRCLSNSLKTVSLCHYGGGNDECAMVGCILRHGSVLKRMHIRWCDGLIKDFETKCELIQQISKFPRKSSVCEVEFDNMV